MFKKLWEKPREKKTTLKKKLTICFGTVFLITFIINNIIAVEVCQNLLEAKIKDGLVRTVVDTADKVDMILAQRSKMLTSIAQEEKFIKASYVDKMKYLGEVAKFTEFGDLAYADASGNCEGLNGSRRNIRGSEEFEKALAGQMAYSSAIKLRGETVLTIAIPVRDSEKGVVGVVLGVDKVEGMAQILKGTGIGDEFFMLDDKAEMVAHSDPDILANPMPMSQMPDEPLFSEVYEVYKKMLNGEAGVSVCRRPETGMSNYVSYAPISNGWSIGLVKFRDQELAILTKLKITMLLMTTVVTGIAIWITYLVAKKLSTQMRDISNYLERVANGEFEGHLPEELLDLTDEVGDTARSLNMMKLEIENMLETVRNCTDYMNEQIEDLTRDIKDELKNVMTTDDITDEAKVDIGQRLNNLGQIKNFIDETDKRR